MYEENKQGNRVSKDLGHSFIHIFIEQCLLSTLYISSTFQMWGTSVNKTAKSHAPNEVSCVCVCVCVCVVCVHMSALARLCAWAHKNMGFLEEKGDPRREQEWGSASLSGLACRPCQQLLLRGSFEKPSVPQKALLGTGLVFLSEGSSHLPS